MRGQALALGVGGDVGIGRALGIDGQDQQIARRPRQLAAQQPQVVAALDRALDQRERRRRILGRHRIEHVEHQVAARPVPAP